MSSTAISDAVSVQHKCKSDHRHDTVLCKSWIQYKPVLWVKKSNNVDRTS